MSKRKEVKFEVKTGRGGKKYLYQVNWVDYRGTKTRVRKQISDVALLNRILDIEHRSNRKTNYSIGDFQANNIGGLVVIDKAGNINEGNLKKYKNRMRSSMLDSGLNLNDFESFEKALDRKVKEYAKQIGKRNRETDFTADALDMFYEKHQLEMLSEGPEKDKKLKMQKIEQLIINTGHSAEELAFLAGCSVDDVLNSNNWKRENINDHIVDVFTFNGRKFKLTFRYDEGAFEVV